MANETEKKVYPQDFKERFEFRLTFGESNTLIYQWYFKIRDFNIKAYGSRDLADVISDCARMIDEDLKDKSTIYLERMAPQVFDTEEEMFEYYKDERHCSYMRPGFGIVIRDEKAPNYAWSRLGKPVAVSEKFDYGEYSGNLDNESLVFTFGFYDNGRLVCATSWEGRYPYEVRKSIDLSNNAEKILYGRKITDLSLREYIFYKMAEGRSNITQQIVSDIQEVCALKNGEYETKEYYGKDAQGRAKEYDYSYCMERYKLEREVLGDDGEKNFRSRAKTNELKRHKTDRSK